MWVHTIRHTALKAWHFKGWFCKYCNVDSERLFLPIISNCFHFLTGPPYIHFNLFSWFPRDIAKWSTIRAWVIELLPWYDNIQYYIFPHESISLMSHGETAWEWGLGNCEWRPHNITEITYVHLTLREIKCHSGLVLHTSAFIRTISTFLFNAETFFCFQNHVRWSKVSDVKCEPPCENVINYNMYILKPQLQACGMR